MATLAHRPFSNTPHASSSQQPEDRLFVRARFDFQGSDPSALSFRAGDVIEVITRLPSGWWDGLLGVTRGWFPSNFVEEVVWNRRDELGSVDAESALEDWGPGPGGGEMGLAELAREMMGGREEGEDERREFEPAAAPGEIGEEGARRRREATDRTVTGLQPSTMPRPGERGPLRAEGEERTNVGDMEDAWVPSLTPDGQVGVHLLDTPHCTHCIRS